MPVDHLRPSGADPARVLLYLHGGGYAVGSARAMRSLAARMAQAMHARACVLDYRLSPEHPYPTAVAGRLPAPREPLLTEGLLASFAGAYLADGSDPADPLVSRCMPTCTDCRPLSCTRAATTGSPAMRLRSSGAREAGVQVEHLRYAGLWHDFHISAPLLADAGHEAPAALGAALARRLQ